MLVLFFGIFFSIISAIEETQDGSAINESYDGPIVGIDLGTTYSSVCFQQNEEVQIIENENGSKSIPTVVALVNDTFLVGQEAKDQAVRNPKNTFYHIKRFLGRKFYYPYVQKVKDRVTYNMTLYDNTICIEVEKFQNESPKIFYPMYIQAKVLNQLKDIASSFLNQTIKNVVITVPVGFDQVQKDSINETAKIAGLHVVKFLSEASAAVHAYAKNYEGEEKNIMVFDFGGGTLDIAVVKIKKHYFEDINFGSEINLGGEDFDQNLIDHFIQQILAATKVNLTNDTVALQILTIEAQKVKETLSNEQVVQIKIPNLLEGYHFIYNLTRAKFEKLNDRLFERVDALIKSVQKDCKKLNIKIDEVILVGGSSRIPKVQQIVEDQFKSSKIIKDRIEEEMVCIGAAIYAGYLTKSDQKRYTPLELKKTPISFGIEVEGQQISKIIPKLTLYPTSLSKLYTTFEDYQPFIEIVIYQGESNFRVMQNKIGYYQLQGIQIALKWEPQILVTFSLDQNGRLSVTAVDQKTLSSKNQIIIVDLRKFSEETQNSLRKQNEKDQLLQKERDQVKKRDQVLLKERDQVLLKERDQLLLKERDQLLLKKKDYFWQQEKEQAITNLNKYINEFMAELLNSQYNDILSQAEKDEIQQLITSSSKWVQQQSKETNTKREHYEKELQNLDKQIQSILYKRKEDL